MLLGTRQVDPEQLEGFFLKRGGPSGEDDLGLWIERRMGDVVGERSEVLQQGLKAMQG